MSEKKNPIILAALVIVIVATAFVVWYAVVAGIAGAFNVTLTRGQIVAIVIGIIAISSVLRGRG